MEILYVNTHDAILISQPITACIGYFDGLHKGHQALIERVLDLSLKDGSVPALITFDPDPWTVVRGIENPPHLTSFAQRCQIMEELGIELCIILQFDKQMAAMSVTEFHESILKQLQLRSLVCGFDFHYGSKGSGNIYTLMDLRDFHIEIVDKIEDSQEKISSSRIERLVTHGQMEDAARLLTRPFQVSGTIVYGNQIGRTYGFPTANLKMDSLFVCPARGVYVGEVIWKGQAYPAIINIGNNPTFNYQRNISIEAHILNFHENLYGETCTFCFLKRLRDEERYPSKDALILQLQNDKAAAVDYFIQKRGGKICD